MIVNRAFPLKPVMTSGAVRIESPTLPVIVCVAGAMLALDPEQGLEPPTLLTRYGKPEL